MAPFEFHLQRQAADNLLKHGGLADLSRSGNQHSPEHPRQFLHSFFRVSMDIHIRALLPADLISDIIVDETSGIINPFRKKFTQGKWIHSTPGQSMEQKNIQSGHNSLNFFPDIPRRTFFPAPLLRKAPSRKAAFQISPV